MFALDDPWHKDDNTDPSPVFSPSPHRGLGTSAESMEMRKKRDS